MKNKKTMIYEWENGKYENRLNKLNRSLVYRQEMIACSV